MPALSVFFFPLEGKGQGELLSDPIRFLLRVLFVL
jgi:hypothetical protein